MDPTYVRILSVAGILVVALLAIVGAMIISGLVARAVQAGLAVAGWFVRVRIRPTDARERAAAVPRTPAGDAGFGLGARAAHGLLARQAWWRLRC